MTPPLCVVLNPGSGHNDEDPGRIIADELRAAGRRFELLRITDPARVEQAREALAPVGSVRTAVDGEGLELHVDNSGPALVEAVRRLDAAQLAPAAMTVREPSLDDVFLELTGKPSEQDEEQVSGRAGRAR